MSAVLVSCFLLLRRFLDLVFVECFTECSSLEADICSFDGSSGGESGHGVRFDGTVTSKGGSIIHLYEVHLRCQCTEEILLNREF